MSHGLFSHLNTVEEIKRGGGPINVKQEILYKVPGMLCDVISHPGSVSVVAFGVGGWGVGMALSSLYLCLETQRGLCPLTMGLRDQCMSPLCVC